MRPPARPRHAWCDALRQAAQAFGEDAVRAACLARLGYPPEMVEGLAEALPVLEALEAQAPPPAGPPGPAAT
jgi:hypothetical protein